MHVYTFVFVAQGAEVVATIEAKLSCSLCKADALVCGMAYHAAHYVPAGEGERHADAEEHEAKFLKTTTLLVN